MGLPEAADWLIILFIVLIIFGGGKIAGVGKSLGAAMRDFDDVRPGDALDLWNEQLRELEKEQEFQTTLRELFRESGPRAASPLFFILLAVALILVVFLIAFLYGPVAQFFLT